MEDPKAAFEMALATQTLYSKCLSTPTRDLVRVGYWRSPDPSFLKLNNDGAIFADLQDACISVILRNNDRDVLMAASLMEHYV